VTIRRIESQIDTNSPDFKANHAAMSERLKDFHARRHGFRRKLCPMSA